MNKDKDYLLNALPKCAVNGSIMGGKGICGAVGVGKNSGLCTSRGYCKHQVKETKND